MYSFRKYTFQHHSSKALIILLMPIFLLQKQYLYSKQQCESCVRDSLALFLVFVRRKVTINEKISFKEYVSEIRLPDCSKLSANWKNGNDVTIFISAVIVNFLDVFCFSGQVQLLVQVSCQYHHWFLSYGNFLFKGLTRNLEIANTSV